MHRYAVLLLCALLAEAGGLLAAPAPFPRPRIDRLISELRWPPNRLNWKGSRCIPGGELIDFSPPMKELIRVGAPARARLHRLLDDKQIQNEVVLILGAIGDETTLPLLIDRYPTALDKDDRWQTKMVCFSFALSYLTGQQIDRSREGTTIDTDNARQWWDWWTKAASTFRVPVEKPNGSWVPQFPSGTAEGAQRLKSP
jgi:hypothetical protein